MDVLGGISVEAFKILAVVVALLVGAGILLSSAKAWHWAIVGAVASYMVITAGIGMYVMMHISDPRWSVGKEPLIVAPSISETPIIGPQLEPIDNFMGNAATKLNELLSIQYALPVASEFFNQAIWAFGATIVALIAALVVQRRQKKRHDARQDRRISRLYRHVGIAEDDIG